MKKKRRQSSRPIEQTHTSQKIYDSKKGILHFGEKKVTITSDDDIYYVFPKRAIGFLHGDSVLFEVTRKGKEGKLSEANPKKLLKRSQEVLLIEVREVRGKRQYKILDEFGGLIVEPDVVPLDSKIGDIFLVECSDGRKVHIIKKFFSRGDKNGEEMIILFRHHIKLEWPKTLESISVKNSSFFRESETTLHSNSLIEGKLLPSIFKINDIGLFPTIEVSGYKRMDFRVWRTMTIDGADAKDLDDAISIARYENGDFLLGVHIADVAEYVEEGTPLDTEAYDRGTSVYTPGRVIPMLPEILSNDKCSLHPGEPKLVLSVLMRIDTLGLIRESHIVEGVIESRHKGVYDTVWKEIESIHANNSTYEIESRPLDQLGETLKNFYSLYKILEKRRKKEGKITFETTECYFEVDEERNVKNIKKRDRNEAHMLIEEFMVLANEEVAKWCVREKLPFLSRVHALPGSEQMKIISEIMEAKHLSDKIEPHHIRTHLEMAKDPVERYRLSRLLLPKMSKAYYGELPVRHFGLALSFYSHFTSPIRRYPDLLVHRIIKKHLHGKLDTTIKSRYTREMKRYGKSLTEKEKRAEDAERAIDALMMCRYMSDKVGQSYNGIISGLTESNIYVELPSGVEGAVFLGRNVSSLRLDPIRGSLFDTKGREIYRIGASIGVKIREVNMTTRRIEMDLL